MKSLGRTELKFLVPPDKVREIVEFLSSFMELDSHADENGYLIRSLYFDSDELATYYQKRAGELTRFKLRLRTYNTLKGNDGFLEIKWKQGSQTSKERLFGDLDYLKALALGEESAFASNVTEAMPSLPGILSRLKMREIMFVEYCRIPFMSDSGNFRITVDSSIKFEIYDNGSILQDFRDNGQEISPGTRIIEVKFSEALPSWYPSFVSRFNMPQVAFSKYTEAVNGIINSGHSSRILPGEMSPVDTTLWGF